MCDNRFLDCFGGTLDLGSTETEYRVMASVPPVLSHFAGHGEQRFVVVSSIFGVKWKVVVWFVVDVGFLPDV